jgi:hypothetical protein
MKYKPERKDFKTREAPPKVEKTKKGIAIQCPFCIPTHPILPGTESPCGTTLKVTAIQGYLSSHATKNNKLHCLKCGQIGGEMIRYRGGWIHMRECAPETKLLTEIPKLSRVAKMVYKMPAKMRFRIEKRFGAVKELQEINEEGTQTGKVLGYFFWKG